MAHDRLLTPANERAFKEVLYRFMGEVHATKAALYLDTGNGCWSLATQYGFGRRDRLAGDLADDHPLVRMVRAFGDEPRFYNDAIELSEVAGYLAGAGSTRLMLAPVMGRDAPAGFVDIRDKGGQRPFTANDLELARDITGRLSEMIVAAAGERRAAERGEPRNRADAVVEPSGIGEPGALLDETAIGEVHAAADDTLACHGVVAVAVTAVGATGAAMLVFQPVGSSTLDVEPIVTHQGQALTPVARHLPPRSAWKVEVRRLAGAASAAGPPVIASAVVSGGGGRWLAASVLAAAGPAAARWALQRFGDRVRAAAAGYRLRVARRGLARRLLQPGDRRFPELVAHSLGVSRLCWSIARRLELDDATAESAALAGLLHDVGMRELDYDRLYMHPTPGPEDRRTYRMHVEVGDRIVRVPGFEEVAEAVRHHHERWDGNGYPDRLAGDTIPLLARIVHVAEVYDLFTAANSYRPPVSRERALAILQRAAGHQFDPTVVEAIVEVVA